MVENLKEQVKEAVEGDGTVPATVETPEKVSSPEVKTEEPKVETPKEPVDVNKLQEQVNNLNVALKEARNEAKGKVDQSKVEELETRLAERENVISRLQNVFAPEKPAEPEVPKYLTQEEAENLWKQKQEEAQQTTFKEKQAEIIKNEIKTLENEWNGINGKPKYVDEDVLKWQQVNSKLYLSPVEAFNQMKNADIIDWEVKQRLAGKKPVENVEQPGVSPDIHTPVEVKPKTDKELRDTIREAINSADIEL